MPDRWAQRSFVREGTTEFDNFLVDMVGCVQLSQMRPTTSTQCAETYQYLAPTSETHFAFNSIANTQIAGGLHRQVIIRASGFHVTGPAQVNDVWMHRPNGHIDQGSGARVQRVHGLGFNAVAGADETWGVDFSDPKVMHRMAGPVEVGRLHLGSGWVLRVNGDRLEIWKGERLVQVYR